MKQLKKMTFITSFFSNGRKRGVSLFLLVSLSFCYSTVHGQLLTIDTILDKDIYKSYFNKKLREPLYVMYPLFRGGGECDRTIEGFVFKVDEIEGTATDNDYAGHGYDKGHLANAEDFAFDCVKEELTFKYYNCVPQTVRMNRGIWKTWETKIRKLSGTKKILIVAGSIFGKKKMGINKVGVPSHCYKIVIDPSTNKILECLVFPNNTSATYQNVTFTELKQRLGYRLMPSQFWKTISQNN